MSNSQPAEPKTSATHPLPLAVVKPQNGGGRIIFTMCPGKVQPHAVTGPWHRDLEMDMDALAAAGASVLLTLMDEGELQLCALSSDQMREAAEVRSMTWLQSPIVDFTAPDEAWEDRWKDIGETLRAQLGNGDTVALHCRGGRGRAGMIAARLLVELGTPPEDAIRQCRTQRPEAIETQIQEDYVRTFTAVTVA